MIPRQILWPEAPTEDLLRLVTEKADQSNVRGESPVNYGKWGSPAMYEFMGHCLRVLHRYPNRGDLRTHLLWLGSGKLQPQWREGWPINHPDAYYTLIHFLTPGDAMPLVVFEGASAEGERWIIQPQAGLSVVIEGSQLHGFLSGGGKSPCIALITQNVPPKQAMH
jgi:hypothetical protein